MNIFTSNLKRFRVAKNLTQEQAAEALGVSTQTVSRWECNVTLPDVAMLPKIAELYCVTIDDLYRETSVAYANYAQRLFSVFEADSNPDNFIRAEIEFRKLLRSGDYSMNDLRTYGILYQFMMRYCRDKAVETFNRVIKMGPGEDEETYWRTRWQKVTLLWQAGWNQQNIDEYLPLVEAGSDHVEEWLCLIQAYTNVGMNEEAWELIQKAEKRFPENYLLHVHIGDLQKDRKCYDEAFRHWRRALELEPKWLDAAFSMGFCYEELGQFDKAYDVWRGVVEELERRGFEAELDFPRSLAQKCKQKMENG